MRMNPAGFFLMPMKNQYIPDSVSPPGDTLGEALAQQKISCADLASRIRISDEIVTKIIAGEASIDTQIATQLEITLGTPATFWLNREKQYRKYLGRRSP